MAYQKFRTTWQDLPSTATPVTAQAINHWEAGIADTSSAVETVQATVDQISGTGDVRYGTNVDVSSFPDGVIVIEIPAA